MKDLIKTRNTKGETVYVIDSREVAEMLGKEHKHVLQYIEGNKDIIGIKPTLESQGLDYQKYFIPSTYKAGTREYKCYLVTKMGCELLGNKQQGEKGILFTAKYVERFNVMEKKLEEINKPKTYIVNKPQEELECFEMISNILHFNDSSKLLGVRSICEKYGMETSYLPVYTKSKGILKSATELLKKYNIEISTRKFNKIMIDKGLLREVERKSTKDNTKIKKFKNLVNTEFGENQVNPNNPKETQPMYYEEKFEELLKRLEIK